MAIALGGLLKRAKRGPSLSDYPDTEIVVHGIGERTVTVSFPGNGNAEDGEVVVAEDGLPVPAELHELGANTRTINVLTLAQAAFRRAAGEDAPLAIAATIRVGKRGESLE